MASIQKKVSNVVGFSPSSTASSFYLFFFFFLQDKYASYDVNSNDDNPNPRYNERQFRNIKYVLFLCHVKRVFYTPWPGAQKSWFGNSGAQLMQVFPAWLKGQVNFLFRLNIVLLKYV